MPMFLSQSVWCDCHHLSPYGILFYFIFILFLFTSCFPVLYLGGGKAPTSYAKPGGRSTPSNGRFEHFPSARCTRGNDMHGTVVHPVQIPDERPAGPPRRFRGVVSQSNVTRDMTMTRSPGRINTVSANLFFLSLLLGEFLT
jgi:hypothetical protein